MDTTYTAERSIKVFNDKSGDFIYIGPDSDGLGLVDIHWSDASYPRLRRFLCAKVQPACDNAIREYEKEYGK